MAKADGRRANKHKRHECLNSSSSPAAAPGIEYNNTPRSDWFHVGIKTHRFFSRAASRSLRRPEIRYFTSSLSTQATVETWRMSQAGYRFKTDSEVEGLGLLGRSPQRKRDATVYHFYLINLSSLTLPLKSHQSETIRRPAPLIYFQKQFPSGWKPEAVSRPSDVAGGSLDDPDL